MVEFLVLILVLALKLIVSSLILVLALWVEPLLTSLLEKAKRYKNSKR